MVAYEVTLVVRRCGSIGGSEKRSFMVVSEAPHIDDKGVLFDLWQDQHSWESQADIKWEPVTGIISHRKIE